MLFVLISSTLLYVCTQLLYQREHNARLNSLQECIADLLDDQRMTSTHLETLECVRARLRLIDRPAIVIQAMFSTMGGRVPFGTLRDTEAEFSALWEEVRGSGCSLYGYSKRPIVWLLALATLLGGVGTLIFSIGQQGFLFILGMGLLMGVIGSLSLRIE